MIHCMVDLETLGTATNSAIVAIGAVAFNQTEILRRFYQNVGIDSSLGYGLKVDGGAIKFWLTEASDQNRRDLFAEPKGLRESLQEFTKFYQLSKCDYLWSHGANFDEPVLRASYRLVYGEFVPWAFRNVRDTRTLFALAGGIQDVVRTTDKHNAVADAEFQALCVQTAYNKLGLQME